MMKGFALKWKGGETYIGSDGSFAFFTRDQREAHLFETKEAAVKFKGDSYPDYDVLWTKIERPRRIPSFCRPKK